MVISRTVHHNAKELLIYIAIILAARGAVVIETDIKMGAVLLGLSLAAVLIRGFYKKFLDDEAAVNGTDLKVE